MKVFNYSNELYDGEGEGFMFSSDQCAMSFYRYPNKNHLKGINLHVHPECDDIDVIFEGSVKVYSSWSDMRVLKAPAIIANYSGVAHAIISNDNKKCLTFGFRSPFKGGETISKKQTVFLKRPDVFFPSNLSKGSTFLFETEYTIGVFHKEVSRILERSEYKYRIFLNLSAVTIELIDKNNKVNVLEPAASLVTTNFEIIEVDMLKDGMLLELIAKGDRDEA